jgi:antitoxin ParD1/3/4
MNVSLTPDLEAFVQNQVRTGVFATADDVVRSALLRMKAEDSISDDDYDPELEQLLIEGLDSGEAKPMVKEDWDNIRKHLEEHIARQ